MGNIKKNSKKIAKQGVEFVRRAVKGNKFIHKVAVKTRNVIFPGIFNTNEVYEYLHYYPTIEDYILQQKHSKEFKKQPLISIIMPTYNTPPEYLKKCIDSVILQSYENWELCIADDASTDSCVVEILEQYASQDSRIKYTVREANGHISLASNSAFEISSGEYISLLDHDDVLWPNALFEVVQCINQDNSIDFIYTDEDKINDGGETHSYPFLKPSWSPEFIESCNYITHFSTMKRKLFEKVGGFRKGYEGAQDWDLFIRIGEITNNIVHLPKILYSWRIHQASTASDTDAKPYVYEAQRKLLEDHIKRQHKKGEVTQGIITQHRTVIYELKPKSLLSVVITFNGTKEISKLLDSLSRYPAGAPFEVIISNGSAVVHEQKGIKMRIFEGDMKDIPSKLKGTSVLIINQPTVVTRQDWAKTILSDTQIEGIGIVYPVLLDKTKSVILSAGYGLGYGQKGVCHMLNDMPFDDPHYTRGLYAKSRRNISAGSSSIYAAPKDIFTTHILTSDLSFIDINLNLIDKKLRNIYTPYLQFVVSNPVAIDTTSNTNGLIDDIYLNPNFKKDTGRMEVDV